MNGIDVLIFHYLINEEVDHELKQKFWTERYGANIKKSQRKIINEGYIKTGYDLNQLKKIKVPQLKSILQENNLSLEGNKSDLIERIVDYADINTYKDKLKKVWVPTDSGLTLLESTEFILYVHLHLYTRVNIIDIYKFYLSNKNLSSKDLLIRYMKNLKESYIKKNTLVGLSMLIPNAIENSRIYKHYGDYYKQFVYLVESNVIRFIDFKNFIYRKEDYLSDYEVFRFKFDINVSDEFKFCLAVNEEFEELLKPQINKILNKYDNKTIFTEEDIYNLILAGLEDEEDKINRLYEEVYARNGGVFKVEYPQYEGNNEHLKSIFSLEPQLTVIGESVLAKNNCIGCGEKSVYVGPEVNSAEVNKCISCGTVNR